MFVGVVIFVCCLFFSQIFLCVECAFWSICSIDSNLFLFFLRFYFSMMSFLPPSQYDDDDDGDDDTKNNIKETETLDLLIGFDVHSHYYQIKNFMASRHFPIFFLTVDAFTIDLMFIQCADFVSTFIFSFYFIPLTLLSRYFLLNISTFKSCASYGAYLLFLYAWPFSDVVFLTTAYCIPPCIQ